MRVLNVCRVLWTGGVQRVSIFQTLALRDLGLDCDLVFLRASSRVDYDLPEGARVMADAERSRSSGVSRLFSRITSIFAQHRGPEATVDLDLIWGLRHQIPEYDVALFNDQYAALVGMYLRLVKGQPYVLTLHEFYPRVSRSFARRLFFPMADLIDATSILVAPSIVTTSEKSLRRLERIVPGRTILARIGTPPVDLSQPILSRDAKAVAALTVWDSGRHPEFYLELAKSLPDASFALLGRWTDSDYCSAVKAAARGIPNLEITGPLSEAEKSRRLLNARFFTSFGYDEAGPGMGGLEALSGGAIVLVNRGIGLSELIQDGVNGFIVDPFDLAHARQKLSQMMSLEPSKLLDISSAAQELCRKYTWKAHGSRLVEAITRARRVRNPSSRS